MQKLDGTHFLIDGFPRNQNNLQGWTSQVPTSFARVGGVLFFDLPLEQMRARVLERGKTSGRSDDNIKSVEKRFHTYLEQTMPIIAQFEAEKKVFKFDAHRSVDAIHREVLEVLPKKELQKLDISRKGTSTQGMSTFTQGMSTSTQGMGRQATSNKGASMTSVRGIRHVHTYVGGNKRALVASLGLLSMVVFAKGKKWL